jgi:transposase
MPIKPVVIVLDNGPIHVSKATLAALAERAHWLTVEWLPKYAPELNDIEVVWGAESNRSAPVARSARLPHRSGSCEGRRHLRLHCHQNHRSPEGRAIRPNWRETKKQTWIR